MDSEGRQCEENEGLPQRCIRSMLGVSRLQQWKERITSRELAETIGMTESMVEILRKHCLRWLGHVARMEDSMDA